jgi:predicted ester cyclase
VEEHANAKTTSLNTRRSNDEGNSPVVMIGISRRPVARPLRQRVENRQRAIYTLQKIGHCGGQVSSANLLPFVLIAEARAVSTRSNATEILTQFIREVWSDWNVEASVKYIAPSYTIHHDPGDLWDKQDLDLTGCKERVRLLRAPIQDQRFSNQDLFADGNAVVMKWLWAATHQGEFPGFPASGTQITTSGATVYYFDGDRLTGNWQISDRLCVYLQLRQTTPGR